MRNEELKRWASQAGPAPLCAGAIEILQDDNPDSIGLQMLVEVISDDQMRHVAGGPRIANDGVVNAARVFSNR